MVGLLAVASNALPSNSENNRRHRDITPSRRVRRCLFGPVDHSQVWREIEKDRRQQAEEMKRKYNFDFVKEEPLLGRYSWIKHSQRLENITRSIDIQDTPTSEVSFLPATKTTANANEVKNERSDQLHKKDVREGKITDFFRAKKRKQEDLLDSKQQGIKQPKDGRSSTTQI